MGPIETKMIAQGIRQSGGNPFSTAMAAIFERPRGARANSAFFEEIVSDLFVQKKLEPYIREKLQGKPLVDLGCGDEKSIEASKGIALYYGARREITDLHLAPQLIGVREGANGARADALAYVLGLPDNYANFMMCGIDRFVISDSGYWQLLAKAIEKKTVPGGIAMGMGSDLYKYLQFSMISEGLTKGTYFVMEKP
ncbi:MAG: hypothetical protein WC717_03235 [Candidatus Micrarchaeia archaeon]|jgi:hypothetical protein